jgi:hypothetical protein
MSVRNSPTHTLLIDFRWNCTNIPGQCTIHRADSGCLLTDVATFRRCCVQVFVDVTFGAPFHHECSVSLRTETLASCSYSWDVSVVLVS